MFIWATVPDSCEGEAISWHLSNLLDVNIKDNVRIAFHEITPTAIKEAIKHPKPLDMNRVDAQQARRVLDRLVGYKISPVVMETSLQRTVCRTSTICCHSFDLRA